MADRKVEPVEHTDEHQPTSSQNNPKDAQSTSSPPPEGTKPLANISTVRNSVLDEVVANQDKQIAELERKVEKKKETIRKLSHPSTFIPPPGLSVVTPHIPPSTVPQPSASLTSPAVRPQTNKANPSPTVTNTANSSQQQPHQSQPIAHNPAMAATVAAMAAASTPVSTALHPHFSFFPYHPPDNHVMTFGVVPTIPPHSAPQPLQPPNSATPSQPNQSSDDGGNRQSRYWTPDEHQRFLAGRRTYGARNYQQIAEVVGTRNAKQVRTHSQKYQQKLEREEARRRGDGRVSSDVHSGVRAVVPKVTTSSDGNSMPAPSQTRQSDGHRNGSSPASGKNPQSNEAPHSSKSAEGSSSANNGSTEAAAENSINAVHVNAAARAVAAEAVALSRGKLPPGAIMLLKTPHVTQSQTCSPHAQSIRPRETITVKPKPSSSQTQPAPTGTNATCSVKAAQNGKQSTSDTTNHLSKQNISSNPCDGAKVSTPVPASGGDESRHIKEPGHQEELPNRILAKASSRESSNPPVNGTLGQMQEITERRPDQKPGGSAVKIEPRIDASKSIIGTSSGSHDTARNITQPDVMVPVEPKSTLNAVTNTVQTNGGDERMEEKAKGSVIKSKPAKGATIEGNGGPHLSKTNSLAAHPEKQVVPNGQHPSANSREVKPGEESDSSKIRDSPSSPKGDTPGEVQCDSGIAPRPNGSARGSNSGVTDDTGDMKKTTQESALIVAKREEGAVHVVDGRESNGGNETDPKDVTGKEGAECGSDRNSMVICTGKEEAKGTKDDSEVRAKNETGVTHGIKGGASSAGLKERIPNGGGNVGDKGSNDGQAEVVDGSQGRKQGGDVEKTMEIIPNENGDEGEFVSEDKGSGSEQAEEKRDQVGESSGGGVVRDKAVESERDRQDMKRRLGDMTESAGKRQRV